MAAPLTTIANRMTPSVPIEFSFGTQVIATGRKFATLFGHVSSSGGTGTPYEVYTVQNVGDPVAGGAEVDAIAGTGSQISAMARAFINANLLAGNGNFPAFRVVLLPYAETSFGPNNEAINAVQGLRSDLLVNPYPAGNSANQTKLTNLAIQISGIDRDLNGQFGTFCVVGSLDSPTTQEAYNFNSQYVVCAGLPDSNTAAVPITGTVASASPIVTAISQAPLTPTGSTTSGSAIITGVSSVAGIYPGAAITGTGIPANSVVETIVGTSITINQNATATSGSPEALSITNLPTAGIYPGAQITGTDIPANTTVLSVQANTLVMSANATGAGPAESIAIQNVVSQAPEIVAASHAAGMLSSAFPYNPLQGVVIGGLIPPQKSTDWIIFDPNGVSEAMLQAGISPVGTVNGQCVFIRTRTTWTMVGLIPKTAYFDWQDLVTMNDFREDVFLISQNPPFNNNPGGTKASLQVANLFKDEVLREAQDYEDQGAFQGVQALASQFKVAPSTSSRGRFDFQIPINVLPGLYVIAGNIVASTQFDFTL